jgi:hypothetical protein
MDGFRFPTDGATDLTYDQSRPISVVQCSAPSSGEWKGLCTCLHSDAQVSKCGMKVFRENRMYPTPYK